MIDHKYKNVGFGFLLGGIVLTTIYFVHRVEITLPVIAISSSYINTKYFTIIQTNIFEELIFICFLTGFLLTVFSREKSDFEEYRKLREEAWQIAILLNSALIAIFIIFVYGAGFIVMLIFNMFSVFILYHSVFLVKKRRLNRKLRQWVEQD